MRKALRIILSAGHDVVSTGANANGLCEHAIAHAVGGYVVTEMSPAENIHYLAGDSLSQRIKIVNAIVKAHPDDYCIAVELHCDSGPPEASGPTTFFHSYLPNAEHQDGRVLAECLISALAVNRKNRGARQANKSQHKRLAWVSDTHCPAVLVELGFLTSNIDHQYLAQPLGQRTLAWRVATGITAFELWLQGADMPPDLLI